MKQLLLEIDILTAVIDKYTLILLGQDKIELINLLSVLAEHLKKVFPGIVESYERKELSDKKEEQEYWVGQLGRITTALSGEDRFLAIDILYYETRANLSDYVQMIKEKGLE